MQHTCLEVKTNSVAVMSSFLFRGERVAGQGDVLAEDKLARPPLPCVDVVARLFGRRLQRVLDALL
jgi:hypothetical protein